MLCTCGTRHHSLQAPRSATGCPMEAPEGKERVLVVSRIGCESKQPNWAHSRRSGNHSPLAFPSAELAHKRRNNFSFLLFLGVVTPQRGYGLHESHHDCSVFITARCRLRRGSVRDGLGGKRTPLLLGDAKLCHEGEHVAQAGQIAREEGRSVAAALIEKRTRGGCR
jgi:hypothetical protein